MSVDDVQAEINAPNRIEFRGNESRWEALFHLGLGGAALFYFIPLGGHEAILGGFFGALFLLIAFGKAFGDLDRSVHLAFDEEGLTVPHIFARKLPWIAVQSYSFDPDRDNGWALIVGLTEPKSYEPHKLSLANFPRAWPLTKSGFRLPLDGVAGDEKDIELAFRRFAPQVRKV